jgi:glycosyltransferase involved in cell wall biosynthesis
MAESFPQGGKVVLLAPRMESRGTSEYSLNLARELKEQGIDVTVLCAPGPMLEALSRVGVTVEVFDHLERFGLRLGERKRFLSACKRAAPQLIHAQGLRVADALRVLARDVSVPLVLTMHWVPEHPRPVRRLCGMLSGIIATSQTVREGLVNDCGVARDKVKVIPNGIDARRLEGRTVEPILRTGLPVIASLGPIEERRGHELFVRAAALVAGHGREAQFVIAGEGDELPGLRRLIRDLGLERSTTLATDFGTYEDIIEAIDIVVQSSQVDVSGFSILEAMAHGRPVVAFSTGTACEIIEDGKSGLLIPKGDVEALAAAIEDLIANPPKAREMGQSARRHVRENFDARALARQTVDYYASLLSA